MLYDPRKDLDNTGKRLLAAADLLEEKGWCRLYLFNKEKQCALGAIYRTCSKPEGYDSSETHNIIMRLDSYLRKKIGLKFITISIWNDVKGRTKKQVIQAFREAAYYKE